MNTYLDIETIFARDLHYRISYVRFRSQFRLKAFLLTFIVGTVMVPQICFQMTRKNLDLIYLKTKMLNCIMVIGITHMLFNFDLLHWYMKQLKLVIERDAAVANGKDDCVRTKLKHYKMIHLCLWENCQRLNRCFGWAFVVMFMKVFVHTVINIYWQIAQLKKANTVFPKIRMYS